MELKSTKYKKRLIAIVIILIIAMILGYVAKAEVENYLATIEETISEIQGTTEEQYNEAIAEKQANGETVGDYYETKEKALETFESIAEPYRATLNNNPEIVVFLTFWFSMSGSIMSVYMFYIFASFLINKIWPDLKKWLSVTIITALLILIITFKVAQYVMIIFGVVGQVPFIIYTIYKYIKAKKEEKEDDVIQEN